MKNNQLLPIGTKVKLSEIGMREYPGNKSHNPHNIEGIITSNTRCTYKDEESFCYTVHWPNDENNGYRPIDLIEASKMTTLKIGDKVQIIKKSSSVNKLHEFGVITEFGKCGDFRVKTATSYDDLANWQSEDEVAAIKIYKKEIINKEKQVVMKFKVGDKVKINGHYAGSINKPGDIGVISEIHDNKSVARVLVNCRGKSSNNWEELSTLELVLDSIETFTVSKDFIKLAHKAACTEWKAKLEEQFPLAFEIPFVNVKAGDRFFCTDIINGEYILSVVETNKVALINLENGNRWNESVLVLDTRYIAKFEFQKICGNKLDKFTKIIK